MKQITLLLFLLLAVNTVFSQNNIPEPSNQTIIRLIIVKDSNKILMRATENGWMTPAVYFVERQNIRETLESLANSYGVKINEPRLGGLFTYKYEFKATADMRQHFVAEYKSGELKAPNEKEKVEWMPFDESLKKLSETVPSLGEQTKQILSYPETLWGGSFLLSRANGKLSSKVEEPFYDLKSGVTAKKDEPQKKTDNYTIQWLLIFNEKNEVLMLKDKFGWKTPVLRSNENQSVNEGLEGLATAIGISIDKIRLAGLFTYKYSGLPDHKVVSFRSHYSAKLKSGKVIQPKDGNSEYIWIPTKEAANKIEMESLKMEIAQIISYPKTIWGGSFLLIFKDEKFQSIEILEKFYPLSGEQKNGK